MDHSFTASDGTRLNYSDLGPREASAVILCHGLGAGAAQFAADAQWFVQRGHRVLVPDLRGHGHSGGAAADGADAYSPQRLMRDQLELLNEAGIARAHWVGNSLGGIIGLRLVAEAPERFASLAIFGTALALSLPVWTAGLMPLLDRFPGRRATARLTANSTTRNRAARPIIADLLNRYETRAVTDIVRHISRYDLRAAATEWTGPGLVLVGGRDAAVNRALHGQLAPLRARPNWQIVDLPQGGHCANLDATDAWRDALLAFWQR